MTDFYSNFSSFEKDGQTAQQYFYKQIYEAFKENTQNNTLPFFNKDLNKIPRELTTGKVIDNENSIALEQIASRYGYKSNNVGAYKAGLMLCTALNAGTEFQRISVAKDYNLENAKRIEEMKVAETNRTRPYQRGGGGWSY